MITMDKNKIESWIRRNKKPLKRDKISKAYANRS